MMTMQEKKGFTLMEMLIVVAIIGVLVSIAMPTFNNAIDLSKARTDASNVRAAKTAALTEFSKGTPEARKKPKIYYFDGTKAVENFPGTDFAYGKSKEALPSSKQNVDDLAEGTPKDRLVAVMVPPSGPMKARWTSTELTLGNFEVTVNPDVEINIPSISPVEPTWKNDEIPTTTPPTTEQPTEKPTAPIETVPPYPTLISGMTSWEKIYDHANYMLNGDHLNYTQEGYTFPAGTVISAKDENGKEKYYVLWSTQNYYKYMNNLNNNTRPQDFQEFIEQNMPGDGSESFFTLIPDGGCILKLDTSFPENTVIQKGDSLRFDDRVFVAEESYTTGPSGSVDYTKWKEITDHTIHDYLKEGCTHTLGKHIPANYSFKKGDIVLYNGEYYASQKTFVSNTWSNSPGEDNWVKVPFLSTLYPVN